MAPANQLGKLRRAVRHVLAAEHAQVEHLLRRQFGRELGVEAASLGRDTSVAIVPLHPIVDDNCDLPHGPKTFRALTAGRNLLFQAAWEI